MKFDPFKPVDTAPPRTLGAFFRWCLSGSWPVLGVAGFVSAFAGTLEVVSALLLGWVIDAALASEPGAVFTDNAWLLVVFAAFYLVLRPLVFGASAALQSIWVGPNVMPQVLSRIHRWTLGQAVTFFDNDFATAGVTVGFGEASAGFGYNFVDEKSAGVTHIFVLSGDTPLLPNVELQGDVSYADPEGEDGNVASVLAIELGF